MNGWTGQWWWWWPSVECRWQRDVRQSRPSARSEPSTSPSQCLPSLRRPTLNTHSRKAKTHTLKTSHRHDRCGDGRRAMMEMVMAASRSSSVIRLVAALACRTRSLALRHSHRARERERAPTRVCVRRYEPASRPLCLVVAVASYLSRPLAISRTSVSS